MSTIEWTDATWNPVAGCSITSAGCTHCYAMRMAHRLAAMGQEKYFGLTRKSGNRTVWTGEVSLDEAALEIPLRWRKPRNVFVNSMSDLFHPAVPTSFIARVWRTMAATPQHNYQILTKRPDRMRRLLTSRAKSRSPLPNVWLGVSVENDAVLDRIDALRATPAAVRFVSFEPLIGSVARADLSGIDWAIVGGESGSGSRPMDEAWVREVFDLCRRHGTAFFFKQWGGTNKKAAGRLLDGRTYDEMPLVRRDPIAA